MSRILLGLCFACMSMTALAAEDLTKLKAEFEKNIPGMKIDQLKVAPLPGLYEVVSEGQVLYISADGRYILQGDLVARQVSASPLTGLEQVIIGNQISYMSKDGRYAIEGDLYDRLSAINLTEQARSGINMKLMAKFNDAKTIVFSPKDPKYTVTIFTDSSCGYCRKLHKEVPELNKLGVKVRYMLFPRAGMDSAEYRTLQSVWCAKDQREAMNIAKSGGQVSPKVCPNPIAEHIDLARKMGLQGTPMMVTGKGAIIGGYVQYDQLAAMLQKETN